MRLSSEYLPATEGARQDLVLLHGWASDREIWRPLLARLRPWANITLLDLPGCAPDAGSGAEPALEQTLEAVLACAPDQAVYLGWSLGGQLAVELAARYPDRVTAVVTVCSNPRFVATEHWPGMDAEVFTRFRSGFSTDPIAALKRFDSLQTRGSPQQRLLMRQLCGRRADRSHAWLGVGLDWLESLDQRARLPALAQPQLHLLAEMDGLVSTALCEELARLLASKSGARIVSLAATSHVAPLDSPDELAGQVGDFLLDSGLLRAAPALDEVLDKIEVANSFSRSASRYDSVAKVQRDVGARLLTSLESVQTPPATMLDLGCGTGFFYPELRDRFPQSDYIGLDLAVGMIEFARDRFAHSGTWLVGDAESLPLASGSVDLVFSSLAIQWCCRPGHLFAELDRVMKPGGRCVFTSLGPGTLRELRAAWAAVDAHQHVNTFVPPAELVAAAEQVPGLNLGLEAEFFRMEYQRVRDLLAELKTLGAHNMNRERPAGLTGRRALQGMLEAYEDWREDGLLPATYDVLFGVLEKA